MLALVILLMLTACARPASQHAGRSVDMDAVVFGGAPSADLPTEVYDADTLLHYALEAERAHEFKKAKRLYTRLLDEFPESKLARNAKFGSARVQESITSCADAIPIYAAIGAEDPEAADPNEWVDVHFRQASCLLSGGRAADAVEVLTHVLAYAGISKYDKLEAMVGRAIANKDRDALEMAERDLVLVFSIDRESKGVGVEPETRFVVAKSAYHLGEVYRLFFARAKLEYPQSVLEQRIEEKSQFLLRAQQYYIRAIRLGTLEVATASVVQLGGLYEHFHQDIVALEAPAELNTQQQKLYIEELRKKVAVLLRKAVKFYDEAVALARRTGLKSEWVDKAEGALTRIKTLYLADISS